MVMHEALTGQLPIFGGKRLCELCPEGTPQLQELIEQCLKPDRDERPPSAVEVYLRLQELGKASGVLLLPPGAMEQLVAARKTAVGTAPTLPYQPVGTVGRTGRRRLLIGVAVLLVLAGLLTAFGLWWLPDRTVTPGTQESLLGVQIGMPQQEVVDRIKHLTKGGPMNPWDGEKLPAYLGHILTPADLPVPAAKLAQLDVQRTDDERVCVIFYDGKVCAMVVREPHVAATGRGVKVTGTVQDLFTYYADATPRVSNVKLPQKKDKAGEEHIEIRRFDELGIGFEIERARVTAITLYPPVRTVKAE
jgi:hypothetical protein